MKKNYLQMHDENGFVHFFNPTQVADILICNGQAQITTTTRETHGFSLCRNQKQVEEFLEQEVPQFEP